MTDALVLAGAAIQGAFTAGALAVLSEPDTMTRLDLRVARVVGASSGSLNALYYAAAVRSGQEAFAGQRLTQIWLDDATISGGIDFSLRDVFALTGLSTDNKLLRLFRSQVHPATADHPIELRVVVTNVDGEAIEVGGAPATTFEHVAAFEGPDFDTQAGLERVFAAVAASSALPGLFAPVPLPVGDRTALGLDGGIVDDTPIGHALRGAPAIDRVFVIAPWPRVRSVSAEAHGIGLASVILDALTDERLVRDLRRAYGINASLGKLQALLPEAGQRAAVLDALGWSSRRVVQLVEIRPESELAGNALSGLTSRPLREQYVQAGIAAARAVIARGAPAKEP